MKLDYEVQQQKENAMSFDQKKPFIYHARAGIYYVQFLNPQTGEYSTAKSTGKTSRNGAESVVTSWLQTGIPSGRKREKKTFAQLCNTDTALRIIRDPYFSEKDAEKIVDALKERGFLSSSVMVGNSSSPIFIEYLDKYWDYDKSDYIRDQLATGHKIGRRYCYENRNFVERYIKDFFHERRLFEITDVMVSDFLHSLKGKGYTAATVNCVRRSIVGPLKYAFKKHIIAADPTVAIEKFSGVAKERGILTQKEAEAVFSVEWSDKRAYIGNLIARNTGMRSAEILALRPDDIGIDRIFVRHSFSAQDGLKGTKTDKPRIVPISSRTYKELRKFMEDGSNPFLASPERFIFFSSIPNKPMEARLLSDCLSEALEGVGISEKERKERNICFHSWRHYAAKYLADHADKDTAMLITGHATESVFEHYADHQSAADAEEAFRKMQAALDGIDEVPREPLKLAGNTL